MQGLMRTRKIAYEENKDVQQVAALSKVASPQASDEYIKGNWLSASSLALESLNTSSFNMAKSYVSFCLEFGS